MTVQKFRSIEEMNAAAPRDRHEGAQAAFERFARHCARYWHAAPKHYPRGVFKFRSAAHLAAMGSDLVCRTPADGLTAGFRDDAQS